MRKRGFLAAVFGGLLLVFLISLASKHLFGVPKREAATENIQEDIREAGANEEGGKKEGTQGPGEEEGGKEAGSGAAEETSAGSFGGEEEEDAVAAGNMSLPDEVAGNEAAEVGNAEYAAMQSDTAQSGISVNSISVNRIPAETLLRRKSRDVPEGERYGSPVSGNGISGNDISGNGILKAEAEENDSSEGSISGNRVLGADMSPDDSQRNGPASDEEPENGKTQNPVSGNSISGNNVSGNTVSGNIVSGNHVSGNSVSDILVSGNAVSGNSVSGNAVSGNAVSGNGVARSLSENAVMTLAQRQKARSSHKETLLANTKDRETISGNSLDFSNMKIACLGDSITEASNLERLENYKELSYPAAMEKALGAREVYNLGIGGSSIGRYWADAFVDRYQEIPQDTDLILVMGGTNDGFCASMVEFGTPAERKSRTFWGDLNELMDGLAADYPYAEVIFLTPLPNGLHDYLKKDHPYLISQEKYAQVIMQLASEHDMEVIDLYNSNILDGHDKDNALHLMPDSVHPNVEGYRILGEHVAAEIIRLLEERYASGEDTGRQGGLG